MVYRVGIRLFETAFRHISRPGAAGERCAHEGPGQPLEELLRQIGRGPPTRRARRVRDLAAAQDAAAGQRVGLGGPLPRSGGGRNV